MSTDKLQEKIIAEVIDITSERELAQISAFILSLRTEIIAGEEHWRALPVAERERMITAVQSPDFNDGSWIPNEKVANKYRKWFD